jgi:hypothetical protein
VEVNEGLLLVNVRARGQEADRGFSDGASQSSEAFLVTKCLEVRREMQRLQSSAAGLELENEISRLQHLEGSRRPGKWTSPDEALDREQLKTWCRLRDEFLTLLGRTYALEDEGLLRLYGQRVVDWEQWQADLERAHLDWNRHLRELFLVREGPGNEVTLAVFSEQTQWLLDLTGAYYHLGLGQGWQVQLWQFVPRPAAGPGKKTSLARRVVSDSEKFLNPAGKIWVRPWDERKKQLEKAELVQPLEGVVGAALEIRGSAVNWRLTGETGLHILQGKNSGKCLVEAGACSMKEFVPPEGVERRGAIGSQPKRRIYQLERGEVEDLMLRRKFRIRTAELHLLLAEITDQLLQDRIRDMLNS